MFSERFRDQLLGAEPLAPHYQQSFERELDAIASPKLTRGQRLYYIAFLVGMLLCSVNAVASLLVYRDNALAVVVSVVALVLSLAVSGLIVHILRRGAEDFRIQQQAGKILPGIALMITGGLLLYAASDPAPIRLVGAAFGFLFFQLTSFINLYNRRIASERITREHLLRVEYRLDELAERMAFPISPKAP